MSRSEPKLGLGVIVEVEGVQVVVLYPAAEETRRYSLKTAPLVRVLFKEGDEIQNQVEEKFRVERVEETETGLVNYYCLLYTSPSPRDRQKSRMPSSA